MKRLIGKNIYNAVVRQKDVGWIGVHVERKVYNGCIIVDLDTPGWNTGNHYEVYNPTDDELINLYKELVTKQPEARGAIEHLECVMKVRMMKF